MKTEYIEIIFRERTKTGITCIWEVVANSTGSGLGLIKWNGAWRQYTFHPYQGTTWSHQCMTDVGKFLVMENDFHKSATGGR